MTKCNEYFLQVPKQVLNNLIITFVIWFNYNENCQEWCMLADLSDFHLFAVIIPRKSKKSMFVSLHLCCGPMDISTSFAWSARNIKLWPCGSIFLYKGSKYAILPSNYPFDDTSFVFVQVQLMTYIKRLLDPNGILNPYKVLPSSLSIQQWGSTQPINSD